MAQRLISRNRLAEALDLLNETIRQDPRFAATFENRAVVFEALGMHPQAQADRRKAVALRAAQPAASVPPPDSTPAEPPDSGSEEGAAPAVEPRGDEPSEGDEAAPPESTAEAEDADKGPEDVEAAPGAIGDPQDEPPPPVLPSYPPSPRRSIRSPLLRAAGVVAFALGVFSIAGVGIYFALNAIGDNADDNATPAPTESPAATDEAGDDGVRGVAGDATDVPATVEEALSGSPYSVSHLEDAWHARALAVSIGGISESVTGFGEPAVDITLTGNGATMELSVLIYSSADAKDTEWTLGVAPEPKVDGELPAGSSVWYNANAVVVVRVSAPALRQDALDGFLALGEAAGESPDEE
jgi:hypothetical protein